VRRDSHSSSWKELSRAGLRESDKQKLIPLAMSESYSASSKELYLAAPKQAGEEKLAGLVYATELAIFNRVQELADSADGDKERIEIETACLNLLALKTLILNFPSPFSHVVPPPSNELTVCGEN
jgi:hypothetical protein